MIYTLTLNPSIDYIVELPTLNLGELNRTTGETKFPGGKGINVSRVLEINEVKNIALGFIGGFTGLYIESYLQNERILTDFVQVDGDTRINIKLKTAKETEINANGPIISKDHIAQLLNKIEALQPGDILVLAGSIPSTMPKDIYESIVKICHRNQVEFIVDAEEKLLKTVLPYKPFLIKPNHHELSEFFETEIMDINDALYYARKLLDFGAKNVIVSMAEKGAIFVNQEMELVASVPKGEVKSSVGAGDSMVAGFLAAFQDSSEFIEAFRYSVASGSATAFSLGLCDKEKIKQLVEQIEIHNLQG
ncbi:1-phosphofructokinase [Neobacillus sp. D3-1R]|uniref:1-phosphofructokinase n=1 Tax=Neobacillus sp. D3-1R TaxID=3445778 RepID=UPI003FA0BE3D